MDKPKLLEALKSLKEAIFSKEQKFNDVKTKDGLTIVRYDGDMPMVGMEVYAVTEQGAIALPDGDYEFEDGTKISVAGGVIATVTPVEGMSNDGNPTPAQGMNEAQVKSVIESVIKESHYASEEFVNDKIVELAKVKEEFSTQKTSSEKEITELKSAHELLQTQFSKALELIEKIAELPSAAPAEPTNAKFNINEFRKSFKEDLQKITQQ